MTRPFLSSPLHPGDLARDSSDSFSASLTITLIMFDGSLTDGHVVGVDRDGKLGREALAVLQAMKHSQFDFVEGDIQTLDTIPGAPLDMVYARLLLIHTPDPYAMLRTLMRWVRPGGYLVVQDYDLRSIDAYPLCEPLEEFKRVFYSVFQQAGRDLQMGRKLPWYFVEADHIGAPDGADVAGILAPMGQSWEMVAATYQSVLPVALKLGITTPAQSVQLIVPSPTTDSFTYQANDGTARSNIATVTFTNARPNAVIVGKYDDRARNHKRNGNDPWLPAWTMQLYRSSNTPAGEQTTDKTERTIFMNPSPGAYIWLALPHAHDGHGRRQRRHHQG